MAPPPGENSDPFNLSDIAATHAAELEAMTPPSKLARARALLSAVVAEADNGTVSGAALGACIPPNLLRRIRAELAELERGRGASDPEQTPFAPARLTNDESPRADQSGRAETFPVAARRLLEWIVATQALGSVARERCLEVLGRWRARDEAPSPAELGALTMTNETLDEARERWAATAIRFALRDIRDEMDRAEALADALNDGTPLPQPSAGDLERWRVAAAELPGPLGRAFLITLAEVQRQRGHADRFHALLARVRCYSIVDTLGNPGAVPSSARMTGIERDIDDALVSDEPPRPRPDPIRSERSRRGWETARRNNALREQRDTDCRAGKHDGNPCAFCGFEIT